MLRHALISRLMGLVIALGLAFGAAPAPRAADITPEIAAFLADGGSLSDLCLPGGHPDIAHGACAHCVLCHGASAALPGGEAQIAYHPTTEHDPAAVLARTLPGQTDRGRRVRAPPIPG